MFHLSLSATIAQETNVAVVVSRAITKEGRRPHHRPETNAVVVSKLSPRKAEGLITQGTKEQGSIVQKIHLEASLLQFASFVSKFLPNSEPLHVVLHFASTLASSDLNHIDRIDPILNYEYTVHYFQTCLRVTVC